MALQKVSLKTEYVKWSEVPEGTTYAGWYSKAQPSKNFQNQMNYYLDAEDGTTYGLNGTGLLDALFERVPKSCWVEVTYLGMDAIANGPQKGRPGHRFDLAFDPDATRDNAVPAEQEQEPEQPKPTPALRAPEQP